MNKMLSLVFFFALSIVTAYGASYSIFGDTSIVASWTGGLSGPDYVGQKFTRPVTDHGYVKTQSGGPCTLDPSSYYGNVNYVPMTVSFATTAVRKVFGYSQTISGQDFFELYVYSGTFDPSNACSNLVTRLQGDEGYFDDHVLFTAGTTFTLVASSINDATRFGVAILESVVTGTTQNSTQLPNFVMSSDGTCSKTGVTSPYFTYEWTQATTGYFDLTGGYPINQTDFSWFSANTALALYTGSASAQLLAGNTCTPNLVTVGASNPVNRDAMITYASLTAGTTYTLASFSQTDDAYGNYGAYVVPSARRAFTGRAFKQPLYKNYVNSNDKDMPTGCEADPERSASGYFSFKFTALYNNVQIANRLGTDARNTNKPAVLYLYEGDNTASPPSTCGTKLLRRHDMFYGPFWFNTKPGSVYTIVAAGVDGESFGSTFFLPVYAISGPQVGSADLSYEGYYIGMKTSSASSVSFCFAAVIVAVCALLL